MKALKPILLSFGLVAGVALGAHAQAVSSTATPGPSIANLPPDGPRANSLGAIPSVGQQLPVAASGTYPGPAPGASTGQLPPRFDKPAGYDQDAAMHPYTGPGMGPKPN
jgi:hypothetical protein